MLIKELVSRVFATRNAVHFAHWKTRSFAEHTALGDFYEELVCGVDKLMEAYQGCFDIVSFDRDVDAVSPNDITSHISQELIWISKNEEAICRDVGALVNILQELEGCYMKALYKLENLS